MLFVLSNSKGKIMSTTAIKVKVLKAMIANAISYRDINAWSRYFLTDLYILPNERTLHPVITSKVLAKVVTSSDAFDAWFILQGIESTFSQEVQSIYVSGKL